MTPILFVANILTVFKKMSINTMPKQYEVTVRGMITIYTIVNIAMSYYLVLWRIIGEG